MKTLATELTIGSGAYQFTYRQIIRDGMHAIYAQYQFGKLLAYEVIRIMLHNGYTMNAGTPKEVYIAPAESMPSAAAWGVHGFSFSAQSHPDPRASAFRKLAQMLVTQNHK